MWCKQEVNVTLNSLLSAHLIRRCWANTMVRDRACSWLLLGW